MFWRGLDAAWAANRAVPIIIAYPGEGRNMSSAYNAGEPAPAPLPEASSPEPSRDEVLEQVIAQTLNAGPAQVPDPAAAAAFQHVLGQYCGQTFLPDPIGVELVRAVLRLQFPAADHAESRFDAMARQIAATLCNDPVARQRLESLWARLCEAH